MRVAGALNTHATNIAIDELRARRVKALLEASGAPGVYFEDYPEPQGYYLPEWSHLSHADSERYTAALYRIIMRDFWGD